MKKIAICLAMAVALVACGKNDEKIKTEEKLKVQADVAKAQLQQKADALARSAATNTQPQTDAGAKK